MKLSLSAPPPCPPRVLEALTDGARAPTPGRVNPSDGADPDRFGGGGEVIGPLAARIRHPWLSRGPLRAPSDTGGTGSGPQSLWSRSGRCK